MHDVLYLIRHGSPQYPNDADGKRCVYGPSAPLTAEGRLQCLALANVISQREGAPLTILVTSPLPRALQTAELLAKSFCTARVFTDDRLRDTDSMWEGAPVAEFLAVFEQGRTFDDPRTGETIDRVGHRMKSAYDDYCARFPDDRLAFISHGDPLRVLYFRLRHPHAAYPPYSDIVRLLSLEPAQGVRLSRTAFGILTTADIEYVSAQDGVT